MKINEEYINSFSSQIVSDSISRKELKSALTTGREFRQQSGKETHFWDLNQKRLHQAFDLVYSRGIEKLAQTASSETVSLDGRISPLMPLSEKAHLATSTLAKTTAIGLGTFAGWFVGWVYTNSQTNLALHEYGHAWAINQLYIGAHPTVSSNALYWLFKGEWLNWLFGVREGAPGNWTGIDNAKAPLNELGNSLTPAERSLFVNFAGMGTELAFNTLVAGLGLVAIRKKHRVLGGALLGFAAISHSAAHSYIRRYPQFLTQNIPANAPTTDPIIIARNLASLLNCSTSEAFRILWFGYLLAPIALIALLGFLFLRAPEELPQEIPDECILMRLLTENTSLELKKVIAEVEVEMGSETEGMQSLEQKKQEELIWKISDRLITKIKGNAKTQTLFENTRSQMASEIKGKFQATSTLTNRLALAALIVALVVYQVLDLFNSAIPLITQIFHYLSTAFIALQGICTVLDLFKTIHDLQNEKLSSPEKALSVVRTLLNIAAFVIITAALFTPGLNAILIPFIIACAAARLLLFAIHLYVTRQHFIHAQTQS